MGAIEQLYWNRAITHEVLLGDATATDVYAAPKLRVQRDGSLRGVGGSVLFQRYGATARFQNAQAGGDRGPLRSSQRTRPRASGCSKKGASPTAGWRDPGG